LLVLLVQQRGGGRRERKPQAFNKHIHEDFLINTRAEVTRNKKTFRRRVMFNVEPVVARRRTRRWCDRWSMSVRRPT
jgi:hypothetical protein